MFFHDEKCVRPFSHPRSLVTVSRRPSTLDVIVAAHTLLLLNPPFPDPVLKDLIIESYPSLAVHARLVLSKAFLGPATSPLTYHKSSANTWSALIPTFGSNTSRPEPSEVEKEFAQMRWGWIGLAIVSTIGYLWLNPLIVIVDEEEDRVEPEKDDEAGNLEDEEAGEQEVLVDEEPDDDAATETSVT
jgi:sorting and assembly machinery component 37